jgi:hypothetical protein
MKTNPTNDQFGEQKAQRRFEKLVKAALNTPPSRSRA